MFCYEGSPKKHAKSRENLVQKHEYFYGFVVLVPIENTSDFFIETSVL